MTFGRDPSRCHIVIGHPNVSGRHATVTLSPLTITDHGSTSGCWINQRRLPANQAEPLEASTIVALGPIPLPVGLALRLLGAPTAEQRSTNAMTSKDPTSANEGGSRRHRTVLGQMAITGASSQTQKIGRTPENDIVLPQPQVSSRHALLHRDGGKLFIEDAGSANGTYVRGQRLTPGQRVAVSPGEKVFIGPMPLLLQAAESREENCGRHRRPAAGLGGSSVVRNRGLGPVATSPGSRQPGGTQDAARPRELQSHAG